ncbi:Leucine rich repeat variant [compost metagenome]
MLSNDQSATVRICVAEHPATPPEILSKMIEDSDQWVRQSVARHPRTTSEALEILAFTDQTKIMHELIAQHRNTLPETLERLVWYVGNGGHYGYSSVLYHVAIHPMAPVKLIEKLSSFSSNDYFVDSDNLQALLV